MSTVTTYLNLVKPATLEQYSIATMNNNLDLIDSHLLNTVAKMAKGAVARTNTAALGAGYSGTAVMSDLLVANLVVNRWYRVDYRTNLICAAAASVFIGVAMKKSITTDVTAAGTSVDDDMTVYSPPTANAGGSIFASFVFKATATETVNLKAVLTRLTGTATYDVTNRKLVLIDLGQQF